MASSTAAPQPLQPPPHLCFGASTLSFLYSHDLHLLEVRKVPVDKLFCLSVSPDNMQFIHDQVHRMTDAMLDSAFLFIQKHELQGGANRVDAYCLSHPSWGAAAASDPIFPSLLLPSYNGSGSRDTGSAASSASTVFSGEGGGGGEQLQRHPPSVSELRKNAFVRKIADEEEVRAAFERFKSSPMAATACETNEDAEQQARNAGELRRQLKPPASPPSSSAGSNSSRGRMMQEGDCRRVVVAVDCTIATYAARFSSCWMGQMMLEGVVNFPFDRVFVPLEVSSMPTLLDCFMQDFRVFSIHAQHNSRLILQRGVSSLSHRFSECNLCNPVATYESLGWAGRYFRSDDP